MRVFYNNIRLILLVVFIIFSNIVYSQQSNIKGDSKTSDFSLGNNLLNTNPSDKKDGDNNLNSFYKYINAPYRIGKVDWELYKFLSENRYESLRFQLGGFTNEELSDEISFGGYIATSFKHSDFKSGINTTLSLGDKRNIKLSARAEFDVMPFGITRIQFLTPIEEFLSKSNTLYNDKYFKYRYLNMEYLHKIREDMEFFFDLDYNQQRSLTQYQFKDYDPNTWFNSFNSSLKFKYSPVSENNVLTQRYFFAFSYGWNIFRNSYKSKRFFYSLEFPFTNKFGVTEIVNRGGIVFGDVPLMNLFEGGGVAKGDKNVLKNFSLNGFQSFETMEPGSFFSDKFISLQLNHHLDSSFLYNKNAIDWVILYKALYGDLNGKSKHTLIDFKTPKNIYQEVGFEANRLLFRILGLGIYSRLGSYYDTNNFGKNLYIKLTLNFDNF